MILFFLSNRDATDNSFEVNTLVMCMYCCLSCNVGKHMHKHLVGVNNCLWNVRLYANFVTFVVIYIK